MEWHWIQDYENRYRIYKNGQVESCIFKKNKIMKPTKTDNGYLRIGLRKGGEKKKFLIHRLIGIHFIPNPENKEQIDHIDGDRTNNSISNLRWVSNKENALNSKNWGKYKKGVYFNKPANKFLSRISINGKYKHLGYYETEDEAHEVFKQKFLEHHGFECCSR